MNILDLNRKIFIKGNYLGKEYIFDAEIATPSVNIDIDIAKSKRLKGAEVTESTEGYVFAVKTLDHVVLSLPQGFPEIQSFEELDDPECVVELFNDYFNQEKEFHKKLKKNRNARRSEKPGDGSRSLSYEGIPDSTETSKLDNGLISEAKTISTRSDVTGEFSKLQRKSGFINEETRDRGENSDRNPERLIPQPGSYPGEGSRVFKGNDRV